MQIGGHVRLYADKSLGFPVTMTTEQSGWASPYPRDGLQRRKARADVKLYLTVYSIVILVGLALVAVEMKRNFFSIRGWPAVYRDLGGRTVPQMQDEDVFYSNVGTSVAAARASDIVFLGPSLVSFAIDRGTLDAAPVLSKLKIFNMSFIGVRSGEFSRRVITRWNIHPPLWVINVDDQVLHFFSDDMNFTFGSIESPIEAADRGWLKGQLSVVARDLKWHFEDIGVALETGHYQPTGLYRKASNGDFVLTHNAQYNTGNYAITMIRGPDCHANAAIIDYARRFIEDIGGNVVFTLIPSSQSCVQQAAELAAALNVELIAPPADGITSMDAGGSHLDKKGAEKFTAYLASHLVKTRAFERAFGGGLVAPR